MLEGALGRQHASVGRAAANFGATLAEAGRSEEAEPLLRRGLSIAEAQAPVDALGVAVIHDNLAGLLRTTGRIKEARGHLQTALGLFERSLPPEHPSVVTARNNWGRYLLDIAAYDEAEPQLRQALAAADKIYGAEHVNIAVAASNLAELLAATGRRQEARGLFQRALSVQEAWFGREHPNLLLTVLASARLELADGQPAAAQVAFERAMTIAIAARSRSALRPDARASSMDARRQPYLGMIDAIWAQGAAAVARDGGKAFAAGQWDGMTAAATALAALGARAGASDLQLQTLTRERQDLDAAWMIGDRRLTELLGGVATRDAAMESDLRQRLQRIEARLQVIDADLSKTYPRYSELAQPTPLDLDGLRRLLAPNEVAVQFVVAPDATHVFAVSAGGLKWHRVAITDRELASLVRAVRCGLDRAEWSGIGAQRCAKLLDLAGEADPGADKPLPFDVDRARRLYEILLGPLRSLLAGKDLLVVPTGSLTALPFHVLVEDDRPPVASPATPSSRIPAAKSHDFARVGFLGRRHAITVLPSLSSLRSLRQLTHGSKAPKPYLGFGNPLLTGVDGTDRRAFAVGPCVIQRSQQVTAAAPATWSKLFVRSAIVGAGVEALRRQPPLPETADELCRVAGFLGASGDDVTIGAKATESAVKAMSAAGRLAEARVLHFATHGLLADETAHFLGRSEPSLVLTPPAGAGTEQDDGLLTASEVAALRLDAEWVVLSACNTASGEDVGTETLSGLARAFFYAGARSLLVSHWAVDSDATVRLVTAAFEAMSRNSRLTQAQAMRLAMSQLIDSGGPGAHPASWAPFIVVGGSMPVASKAAIFPRPAAGPTGSRPKATPDIVRPQDDWAAKVFRR